MIILMLEIKDNYIRYMEALIMLIILIVSFLRAEVMFNILEAFKTSLL